MKVWVSGEGESMELKAPDRPMTFRNVLSHTGGLSYGVTRHPADRAYVTEGVQRGRRCPRPARRDLKTFVEKLAHVPLRYEPGTRWMYSYSTDVCGYLVEALSGQRFDALPAGAHLRAAGDAGYGVLGGTGEAVAAGSELPAAAGQDAAADRRSGDEPYLREPCSSPAAAD